MQDLHRYGEHPRTPSSVVSAAGAKAARERAAAQRPLRSSPAGRTLPRHRLASPPPPPVARWTPPETEDPLDLAALMFDVDRSSLRPAARPRPPRDETYAPVARWDFHVFSDVEGRAWTAHGLTDADQAFQCAVTGLRPRGLGTVVDGVSVLGWLASGEGPAQVVARLRVRRLWRREA